MVIYTLAGEVLEVFGGASMKIVEHPISVKKEGTFPKPKDHQQAGHIH